MTLNNFIYDRFQLETVVEELDNIINNFYITDKDEEGNTIGAGLKPDTREDLKRLKIIIEKSNTGILLLIKLMSNDINEQEFLDTLEKDFAYIEGWRGMQREFGEIERRADR